MNSSSVIGTFVVGSTRRTCVRTVFFRCTLGKLRVHDLCSFRCCRSTASFHPQETPASEPSPPDRAHLDRRPKPHPSPPFDRRKTLLTRSKSVRSRTTCSQIAHKVQNGKHGVCACAEHRETATHKLQALGQNNVHCPPSHTLTVPATQQARLLAARTDHRVPSRTRDSKGNDTPRPAQHAVLDFHAGYQEQRSARTTGTSQRASHIDKQVQQCALCLYLCRQMVPNTQRIPLESEGGVDSSQNVEEETPTKFPEHFLFKTPGKHKTYKSTACCSGWQARNFPTLSGRL